MRHIEKKKRMLLIVDPQIDFINGSLPVPGAENAMDRLACYVHECGHLYGKIVITCDRHPLRHSSFKDAGGEWPSHCIESSVGAAVWPPLMQQLPPLSSNVLFLYKGEILSKEEYSIFSSDKGRLRMNDVLTSNHISDIDICGLAGDVCVMTTLEEASKLYPHIDFRILEDFTASLDGGQAIHRLAESLRIPLITFTSKFK